MKALLCVCFITALFVSTNGEVQDEVELCEGIEDFTLCSGEWTCNLNISRCYCKSEIPFCRCNNYVDEFYLGSSCSVKFTKTTFVLVATLPGIALALLIGISVHLIHFYTKSSRRHSQGRLPAEGLSGAGYTSEMKSRMDGPMASGTTHQMYSTHDILPPSSPIQSSFHMPGSPPYSTAAGLDQVISNPYVRNPYEKSGPSSPNPYDDDDDERMAPPSSSYLAFPRPQITGMR